MHLLFWLDSLFHPWCYLLIWWFLFLLCTGAGYSSSRLVPVTLLGISNLCSGIACVFKILNKRKMSRLAKPIAFKSSWFGTISCQTQDYKHYTIDSCIRYLLETADYFYISQQMYIVFCLIKPFLLIYLHYLIWLPSV